MLLTITTTHRPATDLGFLLHKHPDRMQSFEQSHGTAHVFYPEAAEDRCTAALLLEVDPERLLRRARAAATPDFALGQYVNDRPYAASSLLSVALGDVFRTALRGRCDSRPELAEHPIPLRLELPAVPCRGGAEYAHRLFEPLGWEVAAEPVPLDPTVPDWGDSAYLRLALTGTLRLAEALSHLYVLLPVLDGTKHYWVAADEVDKLVRSGEGWLAAHPERAAITRRYLARRGHLFRAAMARLAEVDDAPAERFDAETDADADGGADAAITEEPPEPALSLAEQRAGAVLAVLRAEGAASVVDLGCGQGRLLARLLAEPAFTRITGVDVSAYAVEQARRRLLPDRMPERRAAQVAERLALHVGSLVYRDDRFAGHDAAVLMEVIEHIDPPRLPAAEYVVFGAARPRVAVVTTPNAEYNVRYEGLAPGAARHPDHRFEWTRAEFTDWAGGVAERYGYRVRLLPVGAVDPELGAPTQLAVFTLGAAPAAAPAHTDPAAAPAPGKETGA
ncbi:3' terminal RNA ribose 2'-O-methyltransferase Hen1 [Allonocardiopsis opalescens]|uniref:Small RNA 2'-O-methyltransferase n=1 Tax=Allonocardiopsis opalescens TaxID=1144618 RepID=A0A2T0Q8E0_9ACTN|nr:3' terminal RNA ribose 2'-O-methyltransferase Hen1 [Allonocardiopsis opalescens]PRY00042.1 3' terminal RNA ribose 2'-O-methyltransferase Hen1 [Allonocardiopsis opalescens]